MPIRFGVFRNDGDDGDRNDGDDGDDGDSRGGAPGASTNSLLAQALWRTRGDLTNGFVGTPPRGLMGSIEPPKPLAPLERENIYGRWSRDVRAHLYSYELLSGIRFMAEGEQAWLAQVTVKGRETFVSDLPGEKMTRPAFDKWEKELKEELGKVMAAVALRPERTPEILTQVTVPYAFFGMVLNLQRGRHRHTYELMSAVFSFSSTMVMQFKNHFAVRRPADRSPLVQPVLPTPGHGSYPAGHATQCHFVATVLKGLAGKAFGAELTNQLDRLAERIAYNRVVAGLHYEPDNDAGQKLGKDLGFYFMDKAHVTGSALEWLWKRAEGEWDNT